MTSSPQNHQRSTIHGWISHFKNRSDQIAIRYKGAKGKVWKDMTWGTYLKKIVFVADLLEKTKKKYKIEGRQNNIALLSGTRWEWGAVDIATVGNGDVLIPLYPNQTDEDFLYILENCQPVILVVENKNNVEQYKRIKSKLSFKPEVLVIEEMKIKHEGIKEDHINDFLDGLKKLKQTDIVSVIYTSGTTGNPKGVVLPHSALVSEIVEVFDLFDLFEKDGVQKTSLAFLPFAHVMGRIEHWGSCYAGYTLAFAESIEALKKNLEEIKPDFLVAVPRIFEKIYAGIINKIETQPFKKKMFDYALEISKQVAYHRATNQTMSLSLILQYEVLSRLVFKPIKEVFGGNLKFAICGGAPLGEDLGTLFSLMGIEILVGYGLTETFAAVTINTVKHHQAGTVGKPIGDVDIKFDVDGEILIKTKKALKEYYKNPKATAEVFTDEGYFRTGDIGEFTKDGYLKITDRKKDLIKTSGGKYVAPQKIENLLKQNANISQVLVIGDNQKYISAIINLENLNPDASIIDQIKKFIQQVNSSLPSYETIKKFEIITEPWTTENGFLTPSLKVKRKLLEKKYSELIGKLYQ
jgi:long-chain acyl-CoA synthetase